ncbi:MAG: PKD domain-containing protein, partial [Pontibacter sp.]|nr:PKD domain-containing protein [Pontibacter sp.]
MKYLLSICFLLLSFGAWAQCFQAIQDGQPVEVICTGKPVFFRDCTANPDPEAVIFYYPGPSKFDPQNYNPNDLLEGEEQTTFTSAGSYTITQIINKKGGTGTTVFEKTFEVKDAPAPAFSYTRCANSTVSFTVTDTNYDSYALDFGDGTTATAPLGGMLTHQYTAQADYTVTLTGTNTGSTCSNSSSQTITVLPQLDQD